MAGVIIVLGAIVIFAVVKDSRPKEPVLFLSYPYKAPKGWFEWFETKVPLSWGWFWRLRDRFRGPAVSLGTWVVELKTNAVNRSGALAIDPQAELGLGQPYLRASNGAMVWRLEPNEVSHLQSRLKRRSDVLVLAPQVSTSDSIQASMFYGNTVSVRGAKMDIGLKVDFWARVRGDNLDLLAEVISSELLTSSETVRTNVALAAQLQLGNKCGVFVVPTNATGNIYGVIFSGNWAIPGASTVQSSHHY